MTKPANSQILKPVILAVPEHVRQWHARDRVGFLSKHARKALQISAAKNGFDLGDLAKDDEGVPLPSNGFYWSITHKSTFVAAVASPRPVGIDLEEIRPVQEGLYRRVAGDDEWDLAPTNQSKIEMFFRFWTAKEAVMKAAGTGIRDLSRIKIKKVQDHFNLILAFQKSSWRICQHYFDQHIVAVGAADLTVEWPAI